MPTTLLRRSVAVLVFGLAFVVNPLYVAGCIAGGDDDAERAAQAEAKLVGILDDLNGQGRFELEAGGVQYELLLELSRAKREGESARAASGTRFTSVAHACGQHTFYQSASACDTLYQLAVEGSFTLRRLGESPETIASDVPVSGMLEDYGPARLGLAQTVDLSIERSSEGAFTLRSFVATGLGDEALDLSFDAQP